MNKLKFIQRFFLMTILIFASNLFAEAQYFSPKNYPQKYFIWPIGAKKALAANFGELRSNHFHMGLDCKSDQAENKDIYAAADGYVTKVKIEPFGFGQAIYINHPNGFQTLYAHLNSFYPELAAYVKSEQYKQKRWQVYLDIPANMFPVKQGQFIAKSGNTGGSMGPHLHFEIRDSKTDKVLNPLLFGFPLTDNVAPDVLRIAVYDRTKSMYEQSPKIISLSKQNGVYKPAGGKINVGSELTSFGFTAWDRYTGSTNQNGIYQAIQYENGNATSGFQLDGIDYIETRDLNGHIDYKTKFYNGPWLQQLSQLPGLDDAFYKSNSDRGVVSLKPNESKNIRFEISDADGNTSKVEFVLQANAQLNSKKETSSKYLFKPNQVNVFDENNVSFYLPANAIYDEFTMTFKETPSSSGRTIFQLHNPGVPLKTFVTFKLKETIPFKSSDKIVMMRSFNNKKQFAKTSFENGWYQANFREFGFFQLVEDTTPPVISTNGFNNGINASKMSSIILNIKDDTEEIAQFDAWLDGEWLLFSNDKGKRWIYRFDEKCGPGKHELKIRAVDLAGNVAERTISFTR